MKFVKKICTYFLFAIQTSELYMYLYGHDDSYQSIHERRRK